MSFIRCWRRRARAGVVLVTLLWLFAASSTFALNNGLARTPPMGWDSWNRFGCNVSEQLIKETADAMATSGMRDAGYQYVNIDDCWQVGRDASGTIIADPSRFPSGIKALADYVHAKGLKLGIYTAVGAYTCQGRPGSLNHEQQDANTYASWGIDYVKVDWCHAGLDPATQYAKMRDALLSAGRPMVYSISYHDSDTAWTWGPGIGNLWRTTGDIHDSWSSMISIADANEQHADVAGPGGWNDPDMLEVGNGGMSEAEYRTHFSLWAMMAAPLIAGNDLRSMSSGTQSILLNRDVIAVDQDPLGIQGRKRRDDGAQEVWTRPLAGGDQAVVLLNRGDAPATISVTTTELGLSTAGTYRARDLWTRADSMVRERLSASVPAHGVAMFRIQAGVAVYLPLVRRSGGS